MYVCICNQVTDRQIVSAVEQGATTLGDITQCLGVAAGCGRCQSFAAQLVNEALVARSATCLQAA